MNALCRVGIHPPVWRPALVDEPAPQGTTWLQVRHCRYCDRPLGRRHR